MIDSCDERPSRPGPARAVRPARRPARQAGISWCCCVVCRRKDFGLSIGTGTGPLGRVQILHPRPAARHSTPAVPTTTGAAATTTRAAAAAAATVAHAAAPAAPFLGGRGRCPYCHHAPEQVSAGPATPCKPAAASEPRPASQSPAGTPGRCTLHARLPRALVHADRLAQHTSLSVRASVRRRPSRGPARSGPAQGTPRCYCRPTPAGVVIRCKTSPGMT